MLRYSWGAGDETVAVVVERVGLFVDTIHHWDRLRLEAFRRETKMKTGGVDISVAVL